MIGSTVLFSEMRPAPEWEDRFNTWYHEDHIPVRMVLDGWQGAQRYTSADDEDYLVIYDMTSPAVLKTPEYETIKTDPSDETKWMLANVSNFTRYIGTELGRHGDIDTAINAPLIFATRFIVPEEDQAEFDEWMVDDHVPLLMKSEHWLGVRRFCAARGGAGGPHAACRPLPRLARRADLARAGGRALDRLPQPHDAARLVRKGVLPAVRGLRGSLSRSRKGSLTLG
jgi:hypothetical protein